METKAVAKPLRAAQSGSEPEQIGLAPEPEPLDQLSRWSRAVSGPSRAVTTLSGMLHVCSHMCYQGSFEFIWLNFIPSQRARQSNIGP